MPPRGVHSLQDVSDGPWDLYLRVPVVTRTLLTTYVVTGLLLAIGQFPTLALYLDWRRVLGRGQVWRLITCFSVIGRPSLRFLFSLVWLLQYGGAWERAKFGEGGSQNVPAATTAALVIGASALGLSAAVPPFRGAFLGSALIYALTHLWSRENPTSRVSFFGFITLPATYLPLVLVAVELVQRGDIAQPLLGVVAGHLYYFLSEVYPRVSGHEVIRTPRLVVRAVASVERLAARISDLVRPLFGAPARPGAAGTPGSQRSRLFGGAGTRLGGGGPGAGTRLGGAGDAGRPGGRLSHAPSSGSGSGASASGLNHRSGSGPTGEFQAFSGRGQKLSG